MLHNALWVVSFFSLWFIILWLQVLYLERPKKENRKKIRLPSITIGVPAYNEEKTIEKTVDSIVKADYPKEKVEIIIVNDGSKDNTVSVVKQIIQKYPSYDIKLVNKKNGGKASANNTALRKAKGELFAVVDADSRIEKNCIKLLVRHFENEKVGAAISRIKVDKPKTLLERMQRFEYIMSNMIRKLMSNIGTLALTPGVLSMYRTELVRKLGGFDANRENLTEDLEIAMRLKYHNYMVVMDTDSITHTVVPKKMHSLWRQRIRWSRGFIYNHWKYRDMFFSKKHSIFGLFQMPADAVVVLLLLLNVGIVSYSLLNDTIEFAIRTATIDGYLTRSLEIPSIKEILLSQNLRIVFPVMAVSLLGIFFIYITHKAFRENISKNIVPVLSYFIFLPYFTTLNWFSCIAQEVLRTKKKW